MKKWSVIWKEDKRVLEKVVKESKTFTEILTHFSLINKGNNTYTLKRRLDFEGIDYSHIPQGKYANKGIARGGAKIIPMKDVLIKGSSYKRGSLKKRLIKEGLLKVKCAGCEITDVWMGKKIVLVLDHINGDSTDNRLENLRFLCPNCNSQTETFCGRNIK